MFNVPHQALYVALAFAYVAASFGLDKVLVSMLLAVGYAMLALGRN